MSKESAKHLVVVVATPGTRLFELAIPCEVFGTDRSELCDDWYDFELVATGPDTELSPPVVCAQGRGMAALADADTIIVPACSSTHGQPPPGLSEALVAAHGRGARIAAICSGAFVLAAAGILDGRTATTHWMHAADLATRYPAVTVDADPLYVRDGTIWTSAGSAAGLDLCLELVRHDLGAAVANDVARRVVTPPHRAGDQAQYVHLSQTRPASSVANDAEVQQWARAHLADVTVATLAAHAGVSERTLVRMFHRTTRTSPQRWLQRERLTAARELLETTDLPLQTIARQTGLGTPSNLRARFTDAIGVSPHDYRTSFGHDHPSERA